MDPAQKLCGMRFPTSNLASLRSLNMVGKALPRPLFTRKTINKTIKGGDVPREEQSALTTVSTGVVPITKRVLVSECCGEGCGSILIPNVYALNRTRTKPRSGEQAQIYVIIKLLVIPFL
jgi:hypothetical protein